MRQQTPVRIDGGFVRIGAKSYAISKINSVEVREFRPHRKGPAIVAGFLCFVMLMMALGVESQWRLIVAALALGFAFLAYVAWGQSKIIEYQLFLTTSSQEVAALTSRDEAFVFSLRAKIESAIIAA